MAHAIAFPTRAPGEHRSLAFWMHRTLEELAEFRANPGDKDTVHDLRVALRRCRAVGAAVLEIDPHEDWLEMRGQARKLFRNLGALRDAQIMREWLDELQREEGLFKQSLLRLLAQREDAALEKATRHAECFSQDRWARLRHRLELRLRVVPLGGNAARCLALERLEEAWELHRRALRTEKARPWHALRIGIKRFRYTAESLVPVLHSEFGESLKRVQDVLGDIQDLHVLSDFVNEARGAQPELPAPDWDARIAAMVQEKADTYRQMALGNAGVWQVWRAGFPRDQWLRLASARFFVTRRTLDSKPRRSLAVTRIALRLWRELRALSEKHKVSAFSDAAERRVLETAARLSGIRAPRKKKASGKSVRTYLLASPLPPGWTFAEWERVAWAIRFERGREPDTHHRKFSSLPIEQQAAVQLLAGLLRLARALQKAGVNSGAALRLESLPNGLLLRVAGVEDSPENAARFVTAKRMLERALSRTLLLQAEPAMPAQQPQTSPEPSAAASAENSASLHPPIAFAR